MNGPDPADASNSPTNPAGASNSPTNPAGASNSPTNPAAAPFALGLPVRLAISAGLLFHLSAILIYPFSSPPSSKFAEWVLESPLHRHYLEVCYLNHSFKFFSPNPGVQARQIRYELELPQGAKLAGIFPDKSVHQPRLFYHRHFMLAEHISMLPAEFVESYARHLLAVHGAKKVTLYERLHFVPVREEVQAGLKLDDPRSYSERLLGSYDERAASR